MRLSILIAFLSVCGVVLVGGASAEPTPESACVRSGCHVEFRELAFVHAPVARGNCSPCHTPGKKGVPLPDHHRGVLGTALVPAKGSSSCAGCHDPLPTFHVSSEDSGSDPCLRCHDAHGGPTQAELRAPEGELCLACHAQEFESQPSREMPRKDEPEDSGKKPLRRYLHGPIAKGYCAPCHTAHGETQAELLRGRFPQSGYTRYSAEVYSACLGECHAAKLVEQARTTTETRFRNGDDNLHHRHVDRGERGEACFLCHAPHQADNPSLIRQGMPFGKEQLTLEFSVSERGGKCRTSCHIPLAYDRDDKIPSRMRTE